MRVPLFYSISEFAKLIDLPAKTLRYYDEIGLFAPFWIDPQTNYRYYHESQLYEIHYILALRALQTPLDDIKEAKYLSGDEQTQFLKAQQQKIHEKIVVLQQLDESIEHMVEIIQYHQQPVLNKLLIQKEPERRLLVQKVKGAQANNLPQSAYSELKRYVERNSLYMPVVYGGIFSYEPTTTMSTIDYTHIFMPIQSDFNKQTELFEEWVLPEKQYITYAFIFSENAYLAALEKMTEYMQLSYGVALTTVFEFYKPIVNKKNQRNEVEILVYLQSEIPIASIKR